MGRLNFAYTGINHGVVLFAHRHWKGSITILMTTKLCQSLPRLETNQKKGLSGITGLFCFPLFWFGWYAHCFHLHERGGYILPPFETEAREGKCFHAAGHTLWDKACSKKCGTHGFFQSFIFLMGELSFPEQHNASAPLPKNTKISNFE